ncbi:hypothetical protein EV368DRAFT_69610 [Lentinula lateritia]|nr:hypothetical protein EV368DRAFT_69610 [Lentinula lateritia]
MLVLEGIIVEDKLLLAGRRTVVSDSLNPNSQGERGFRVREVHKLGASFLPDPIPAPVGLTLNSGGSVLGINDVVHLVFSGIVKTYCSDFITSQRSCIIKVKEHNCILTMYGTKQKCKIFKPHQIQVLNTALEKWNNYPLHEIKKQLAKELNLTNQQVKNHRQKLRRGITEMETPMPKPSESKMFAKTSSLG